MNTFSVLSSLTNKKSSVGREDETVKKPKTIIPTDTNIETTLDQRCLDGVYPLGKQRGTNSAEMSTTQTKAAGIGRQKLTTFLLPLELPIPMIVHQILWTESLTFRNYLSILSIWKVLNPYQIILYTRKSFKIKEFEYNDWFDKATFRIPTLQVVKLDRLDNLRYSLKNEVDGVRSVLQEYGGLYVNLNTVLNANMWLKFNSTFHVGFANDSSIGYLAIARNTKIPDNLTITRLGHSNFNCVSAKLFTGFEICCTVTESILLYNIMHNSSASFGSLARTLFYGSPEIPKPKSSFPPIPKIVHYVWFGQNDINYSMFLSFLSTQKFVKPQKIFIYVDTNKSRPYFDKMVAYGNVHIVYYGSVPTIFQKRIAKTLHVSDIIRAEILLRYGGIYLDWDAYWLKPADDLLFLGYETIASLDFFKDMYPRQGFPDTVNMGVLLARPGSRFISLWQESFKQYTGKHHTYHAVELVYKLYEEHPDLLVIDRRLQVMCHNLKCHPLWLDNYKDDNIHNDFKIKTDVYTVHFTDPTPPQFSSEKTIREDKGYVGDIGRHILGLT